MAEFPIVSVSASVPMRLLARYFKKRDGVTGVSVYGTEGDCGMDVTFRGKTFYIDRQFGEIQAFAPDDGVSEEDKREFIAIVDAAPRNFLAGVLSAISR